MAKAQTDYYAITTRSMLACVKEVGAMPFVLFQYYLTWESAMFISPSLITTAQDLGILDKSGNPSKSAVSNLKKVLVNKNWIEEKNGQIIIKKFRNYESHRSEKMNFKVKTSSEILNESSEILNESSEKMNESSEKMNGTEIANIGISKRELKENKKENIHSPKAVNLKMKKGARIPTNFYPSEKMIAYAREKIPNVDLETRILEFKNYWESQTGANAVKLDWNKTFQNRIIQIYDWAIKTGTNGKQSSQQFKSALEKREEQKQDEYTEFFNIERQNEQNRIERQQKQLST